jgi:hypothetical protein
VHEKEMMMKMKMKIKKILRETVKCVGIAAVAGALLFCSALALWRAGSAHSEYNVNPYEFVEFEDGHRYMKINDLGGTYILVDEE